MAKFAKEGTFPMKTPVTKEKFQNHIHYSLWKYALLALVAIFGWNLVYSVTEPQIPEEKKVIAGIFAYGEDERISAYTEKVRLEYMPDMEDISAQYIMPDEMYGDMILSTRVAARECDIYILPRAQFQSYAAQGAFMPLEEVLPELVTELEAQGISLSRGFRTNDELGEKHQYGIPMADLPSALPTLMCDTSDMYASIFFYTENDENVIKFFDRFIRDMLLEPAPVEETPAQ